MKKFVLLLVLALMMVGCKAENVEITEVMEVKEEGTVVILATGGTIAGKGESGKESAYSSGVMLVEELLDAVEGLDELCNLEAIQVANINSDDVTIDIWCELAGIINEMAKDEKVLGFVITHGTDTMEETAYFLNLTVKTDKPVVLTGSMRPSTSLSPDGPMNLYQAVCVARSEETKGLGVLAVFGDRVYGARSLKKNTTYSLEAIGADEMGCLGYVRDDEVYLYEAPLKKHTLETEFRVEDIVRKPKVQIVYFAAEADVSTLKYMAAHSDGLVIAGAGAGEFSKDFIEVIEGLKIPVVIASRIAEGIISQDSLLCRNTVAANNLSPAKAAVLLRLALEKTDRIEELCRIFNTY